MRTIDGINKTSLALWMKLAKSKTARTTTTKALLGVRNSKTDQPGSADCGCHNKTVVVCQCCVPIIVEETRLRGNQRLVVF